MYNNKFYFFVGSYSSKDEEGISTSVFENGKAKRMGAIKGIENPSYLTISSKRYLYAVSETLATKSNEPKGEVYAYRINQSDNELSLINTHSTNGNAPCYISTDEYGENLFVCNYLGGSFCWYSISENGAIQKLLDCISLVGSSGVVKHRQEAPHPHSIKLDTSFKHVMIPDLGNDQILIYEVNKVTKKFVFKDAVNVQPGAGPRHLAFHPEFNYTYVINELDSSTGFYKYNADQGKLEIVQIISNLAFDIPHEERESNTSADIHIHPSGKFLYSSNRGIDNLTLLKIDKSTGYLTLAKHISTYGKKPRNFSITPDGRYLLVANQDSDNIVVFEINQETGNLSLPLQKIHVSKPTCIKFM